MVLTYEAGEKDRDRKVYGILRHEMGASATLIKRLKVIGGIRVNGVSIFADYRVVPGDTVTLDLDAAERECAVTPEKGELDIILENSAYMAVNKPCGMLVHPSRARTDGTLLGIAAGYLLESGQEPACHVVNRLDRDTSGAVLISKSAHYKTRLIQSLAEEDAAKEYIALLCGQLGESGLLDAPIRRSDPHSMKRIAAPDGQRAVTHFETLDTAEFDGETVSLVRFRLETGRTHQIRVHASSAGAPLLGDVLYKTEASENLSEKLGIRAQALHAEKLRFCCPLSGNREEITAPLKREDMLRIIDRLKMKY